MEFSDQRTRNGETPELHAIGAKVRELISHTCCQLILIADIWSLCLLLILRVFPCQETTSVEQNVLGKCQYRNLNKYRYSMLLQALIWFDTSKIKTKS